ncbi:MAG: TMEM175 family protein [Thermoplasmatota archaeon]
MPEKESSRLEAFSDGVFAFAITLLVLNVLDGVIRIPKTATLGGFADQLAGLWHEYLALVITFGTVYVLWMGHHAAFQRVHHVEGGVLFANGILLLLVSTSALPTAVLADFMDEPAGKLAAAAYAGYFLLVNLAFLMLGRAIATSQGRGPKAHTDLELRGLRRQTRWGPWAYLVAALAAWVSAWATVAICGALWLLWGWVAFARHRHDHREGAA